MSGQNYDYLLPIFIGHPFAVNYTQELRATIANVCDTLNNSQEESLKKYLWQPEFLNILESSRPASILETVRDTIRQSALCIFDISDISKANIFLELGIALGMNRAIALIARKPYNPPSDLHGVRRIEYDNMNDLETQLEVIMHSRLDELSSPPPHGTEVIHQKMQIDANWKFRLATASKSMYFIAGDLSWADEHREEITEACERGVSIYICCRRPQQNEVRKWENIESLKIPGVQIRLYEPEFDPTLRGFIFEPEEMNDITEIMVVEKHTRQTHSYNYARTGVTIGERRFLYKANIYRGHTHYKHVAAIIRLFESTWKNPSVERYWV